MEETLSQLQNASAALADLQEKANNLNLSSIDADIFTKWALNKSSPHFQNLSFPLNFDENLLINISATSRLEWLASQWPGLNLSSISLEALELARIEENAATLLLNNTSPFVEELTGLGSGVVDKWQALESLNVSDIQRLLPGLNASEFNTSISFDLAKGNLLKRWNTLNISSFNTSGFEAEFSGWKNKFNFTLPNSANFTDTIDLLRNEFNRLNISLGFGADNSELLSWLPSACGRLGSQFSFVPNGTFDYFHGNITEFWQVRPNFSSLSPDEFKQLLLARPSFSNWTQLSNFNFSRQQWLQLLPGDWPDREALIGQLNTALENATSTFGFLNETAQQLKKAFGLGSTAVGTLPHFLDKVVHKIGVSLLFDSSGQVTGENVGKATEHLLSEFRCADILFKDSQQLEETEAFALHLTIIPAVLFVIIFAFLSRRLFVCHSRFGGRPGIPIPINLLQCADENRAMVASTFGLAGWILLDVIMVNQNPFHWQQQRALNSPLIVSACLLMGLLFYPFFATISADNVWVKIGGLIYIWVMSTIFFLFNLPCNLPHAFLQLMRLIPAVCFVVHLNYSLAVRLLASRKKDSTTVTQIDSRQRYATKYLKSLLLVRKYESKTIWGQTEKSLKSKLYKNIPGFRYPVSILSGITMGLLMVYFLSLVLLEVHRRILGKLRLSLEKTIASAKPLEEVFGVKLTFKIAKKDVIPYARELLYLTGPISFAHYSAFLIAFVFTVGSLLLTVRNYRRHLIYLYKGKLKGIPNYAKNLAPRSIVVDGTKYVAFQIGYAAWGFVVQLVVLVVLFDLTTALYLAATRYRHSDLVIEILRRLLSPLFWIAIILAIQHLMVHLFFLRKNKHGVRVLALDNRRAFFNFAYFMVFANAPLGLLVCLGRIIKAFLLGVILLPRLDLSTMSRQFERFDSGFAAYVCLLNLENQLTNPALVKFCQLLHETTAESETENNQPINRKIRARTRWFLWLSLSRNPSLRLLRKAYIEAGRQADLHNHHSAKETANEAGQWLKGNLIKLSSHIGYKVKRQKLAVIELIRM